MKLQLIEEWKQVLFKAWSVRFGMAGALCYAIQLLLDIGVYLPLMQDYLPRRTFFYLSLLCAVAGFVSRFLKQKSMEADDGTLSA